MTASEFRRMTRRDLGRKRKKKIRVCGYLVSKHALQ